MQKKDTIVRYSAEELAAMRARGESQTDWQAIDAMPKEEWRAAVAADPDSALPPDEWTEIVRGVPDTGEPKKHMNIRLDAEVWRWFRSQGKGYQSRMNAVLRAYMQHVQEHKRQQSSRPH